MGVFEEIDEFENLYFGFFASGHVGKLDPHVLVLDDARRGLTHVEHTAHAAASATATSASASPAPHHAHRPSVRPVEEPDERACEGGQEKQ